MMVEELYLIQYSPETITGKRAEIARRFMSISRNVPTEDVTRLAVSDLELLFRLYNEIFLKTGLSMCFPGN